MKAYRERSCNFVDSPPREHRPAAERRRDPRLLPGPARRPRPDEQGVQRHPGMRAGIALRRQRAGEQRRLRRHGRFAHDADERPRTVRALSKGGRALQHVLRLRSGGAPRLPTTAVRLRPGRQDRRPVRHRIRLHDGHDFEQLRRVPPPLLRPVLPALSDRRRAVRSGPAAGVRPRSGAGAVRATPSSGRSANLPATKGTRAALPPSRPAAPISRATPAERRHRGVRQPSHARGSVHRPVRQPGGLRRGFLHHARDTAARREVHHQQRLRLAFLHRLQRDPCSVRRR